MPVFTDQNGFIKVELPQNPEIRDQFLALIGPSTAIVAGTHGLCRAKSWRLPGYRRSRWPLDAVCRLWRAWTGADRRFTGGKGTPRSRGNLPACLTGGRRSPREQSNTQQNLDHRPLLQLDATSALTSHIAQRRHHHSAISPTAPKTIPIQLYPSLRNNS